MDEFTKKKMRYFIWRHAWFAVSFFGTIWMIYALYFPDDSVRTFMEDLAYILLAFPVILLYHGIELFQWWRGETFYRGILRALREMAVERLNIPEDQNNPIFCVNFDPKQGKQYDVVGYHWSNPPEGVKVSTFVKEREGRFTYKQVRALNYDSDLFKMLGEGWWEYIPSKEQLAYKIADLENRRKKDDKHRYVED